MFKKIRHYVSGSTTDDTVKQHGTELKRSTKAMREKTANHIEQTRVGSQNWPGAQLEQVSETEKVP